ncbi:MULTISPECIES: hypothetical protein [Streptomyces]|uniref:DUF4232 domain-containing protein n=1 Tax=Streptomyces venezuelae TaxID=54571 RepID=A0A5P2BJU0_STRVZ|nr:hypothetical protein [Streptomyces venezuelae]MYY84718.1 hypothetical protein [Streptomyces sp. SID335]MYZ14386.1 hypothetical protein [Streptomyces sp. SID337]NDZ89929.1 hypothetical protein [Streptomyces sp. SID10115]NDZ99987.1 hypothetical protein [Streptomyces sp. SID10116]NEB49301.1 hypothetical protein [Streptomyces sp. SID339]
MGSLRNPVGPLPSTIYWRRRAVLLSVLGLLVLLVVWIVTSGGGGGGNNADGPGGNGPATSITPGPGESGPAISEHPGGRDESSEGSGSGSGGSGGSGGGSGSGGSGGSGGAEGTGGGGSGDDAKGGGGSGDRLPAGTKLPNCTSDDVKLTVRSIENRYAVDEKPKFELIAENSGGKACKVDLGGKGTVLTITQAEGDDEFWSSADCPEDSGSLLLRVPAEGRITHSVQWDRRASEPQCATPSAGKASPGTYLVEADAPGLGKAQASFVLEKD